MTTEYFRLLAPGDRVCIEGLTARVYNISRVWNITSDRANGRWYKNAELIQIPLTTPHGVASELNGHHKILTQVMEA